MIGNARQLEEEVLRLGFLPFFHNSVRGFSVQERVNPRLWFSDYEEGPWEWKGPVIRGGRVAYGKLFSGKAAYISLDLFGDFANWRRASLPLGRKIVDPVFDISEAAILECIRINGSILSRELKQYLGMMAPKKRTAFDLPDVSGAGQLPVTKIRGGLEKVLTALQMQTRVVIQDFEYLVSKNGDNYGWGLARYTTPEELYGAEAIAVPDGRTPEESRERLHEHFRRILPGATDAQIKRFID